MFDGAIGVFYQALALPHRIRVLLQQGICLFQNVFLLPALDAALFAGRTLSFQYTRSASVGPVRTQLFALFFSGESVGQPLLGRTDVFILFGIVNKV